MAEPGFLEMPPEVLDIIFKQVTLPDKRNLRMVCERFRNVIDNGTKTRFCVVLNNKNCDAIRNLRPSKRLDTLRVEDFTRPFGSTSSTRSILANMNVGELILAGRSAYMDKRVNTSTKPNHYPYLPNEIYVQRKAEHWLTMSDLSDGIPLLNLRKIFNFCKDTINTLVMTSDIFTDLDKMSLLSLGSTPFPNLKSLEFILVHHATPATKKHVNAAIEGVFDWRCQSLQMIGFTSLCPCCQVGINQWIKFYACVIAHKQTLQELKLNHHFHFNIDDFMNGNETRSKSIRQLIEDINGVNLKRLNMVILLNSNIFFSIRGRTIFTNSFEMHLLRSQTQLEVLKLDFGFLFVNGLFNVLPKSRNLKACSIHMYGTEAELELVNLSFLKESKNLKFLQIVCEQDNSSMSPWRLSEIRSLPSSIEHLVLSADLTLDDAIWIQTHLFNLRHIQYYGGIQLDRHYNTLSHSDIETNNFAHFKDCVNTLPNLKSYRMIINNDLIISSLKDLDKNVDFKIDRPFSSHILQFHEQH